jgi:hypothetical protein
MNTYSADPIFFFEGSLGRHEKSGLVVLEFLNRANYTNVCFMSIYSSVALMETISLRGTISVGPS